VGNFVHVNGRLLYIVDRRMMVVEEGNVLQCTPTPCKGEEILWGKYLGRMCLAGMSGSRSNADLTIHGNISRMYVYECDVFRFRTSVRP